MQRWLGLSRDVNRRGLEHFPPGHFYSPLLDIAALDAQGAAVPFDGADYWEHVDLNAAGQRSRYADLFTRFPAVAFPSTRSPGYCYYSENDFFPLADAIVLSSTIRKEQPRRIIEVGSGFSSAAMLDTLAYTGATASLTFIEPYPDRLRGLLSPEVARPVTLVERRVQEVALTLYDELAAHDILFIDSSHVAKVGSDLTHLLLRVLPRLQPGVLVHFHDLFYPESYPIDWIRSGRAWNESLFLRAFLVQNRNFEIIAFNGFAARTFREFFIHHCPEFLRNAGGSLWLRKIA